MALFLGISALDETVNAISLTKLNNQELIEGNTDYEGEAEMSSEDSGDDGTKE